MKEEVAKEIIKRLSKLYVDKKIVDVEYNKETQEFYLILEDGLKISV